MSGTTSNYNPLASLMGYFGGGNANTARPSQGPFSTWSPGYQTPDQLAAFSAPALGSGVSSPTALPSDWTAGDLAKAYGDIAGPGGAPTGAAGSGFGVNLGTGQLGMSGLQTLGKLWESFQANQLANKSFNFAKNFANTNLANQIQSYNTNLAGQADARFAQENKSPEAAAAYVAANRLPARTV